MTIYERIKTRRKELGLSADTLAKALNVSRATIYRYESAYIEKLPLTTLTPLSQALNVTPSYLMGWEDLCTHTEKIIQKYNTLNTDGQNKVDEYIDDLLSNTKYIREEE